MMYVGHDVVPFSLGDIVQETSRGVYAALYADGGAGLAAALKDVWTIHYFAI